MFGSNVRAIFVLKQAAFFSPYLMPESWFVMPAMAKNVICGQYALSNFFGGWCDE